jgi:3-oxoacyl-[acyl-carrier protein] reductase
LLRRRSRPTRWAAALGPKRILVNAVARGVIETAMSNFTKTEAGRKITLDMQALKRIGQPSELFAGFIS